MRDINKAIADERGFRRDPEGHLADLERWSVLKARQLADAEEISLEEEHWLVIYALRDHFREHGPFRTPREALKVMEGALGTDRQRELYALFARGPVMQACRIAGLPLPPGTVDRSFGSTH